MTKILFVIMVLFLSHNAFSCGKCSKNCIENWTIIDQAEYCLDPDWKAWEVMYHDEDGWNLC